MLEKTKQPIVYTDLQGAFTGEITEVDLLQMATGTDKARFNAKIRDYLRRQPDNLALQKLRTGKPLNQSDMGSLQGLLARSGAGSGEQLQEAIDNAHGLGRFIRSLAGLDQQAVNEVFAEFIYDSNATADQIHFVGLVVANLTRNGALETKQLFDPPFVDNAPQGPTQVFPGGAVHRLIGTIERINSSADEQPA